MSEFWTGFVCSAVDTLPYRLLSYYPFRRQLRFPGWVAALLIAVSQLAYSAGYGYMLMTGRNYQILNVPFVAACLLIYLSSVRVNIWKVLFLYIFIMDYIAVVRGIAMFVEASLFFRPNMVFTGPRSAVILMAVFALTAPLILLLLHNTKDRVLQSDAPALWRVVWVLPAFMTLVVLLYTTDLTPAAVRQPRFLISRGVLIASMFVIYGVLLYALDAVQRETLLRERAARQDTLLAMQRTQYNQLTRHIQEATQARHDLRQHLRIIRGYLQDGSRDALRAYVERYEESLPPDTSYTFCRNWAVNTIVCYYNEEARKAEVDFSVRVSIPERPCVSEPELCAILGNLLENALDACRGVTECAPFIRLRAEEKDGRIALVVDNTCLEEPSVGQDGRFRSSKHEGFGTGTASVRDIARRHGGSADFRCENKIFYASVLLFGERGEKK